MRRRVTCAVAAIAEDPRDDGVSVLLLNPTANDTLSKQVAASHTARLLCVSEPPGCVHPSGPLHSERAKEATRFMVRVQ